MTTQPRHAPPVMARALLAIVLDPDDRAYGLADLDEEFGTRVERDGRRSAHAWYRSQLRRSVVPSLRRRLRRLNHRPTSTGAGTALAIRYALRGLRKSPGYTFIAVASLAIGIGATAAVFSVANGLLFAPIGGLTAPERLVDIGTARDGSAFDTLSYPTYRDLQAGTSAVSGLYATDVEPRAVGLGAAVGAERVYAQLVSANYFDVLGVRPGLGVFFAGAEKPGVPLQRAVLSHGLWQSHFGGVQDIVGQPVRLNGVPFTVAAVAPEAFRGTTILAPDLWVPLSARAPGLATDGSFASRRSNWLILGGRLQDDVSVEQAQASFSAALSGIASSDPALYEDVALVVAPMARLPGLEGTLPYLALLLALVSVVLLIACANLAGIMLARSAARARETAVQLALGASRRQIALQTAVESVLVFVAAGSAGLLMNTWMTAGLWALLPPLPVPLHLDFAIDGRVLVFVAGLSGVACLVTTAVPAWKTHLTASSLDRSGSVSPARQRTRQAFVVAQIALCMLLIVVAGLFGRALQAGLGVDPGFEIDPVTVANLDLSLGGYDRESFTGVTTELHDRLAALPGIERVGIAAVVPLEGRTMGMGGLQRPGGDDQVFDPAWNVIDPDYLPALGLPIRHGRGFTAADVSGAPLVAVVDERLAALMWPGESAVGQTMLNGGGDDTPRVLTIVGVVPEVLGRSLGEQPGDRSGHIYVALAQHPRSDVSFFVRRRGTTAAAAVVTADIRTAVTGYDPNLPIVRLSGFRDIADVSLVPQRIAATIAGTLGLVGLLLGGVGIFGVTAFYVAARTRELGIRMALGADRHSVRRLVIARALRLGLMGGALGLAAAAGLSQLFASLLYGVSPLDPATYSAMAVAVLVVTLTAAAVPAIRATRVDPLTAMRVD